MAGWGKNWDCVGTVCFFRVLGKVELVVGGVFDGVNDGPEQA